MMLTLKGKYNKAKVMTYELDEEAFSQVYSMLNNPAFEDMNIVIMEDAHKGEGSVIGFTATINGKIIPNIVGVDIGCGVDGYLLENISEIDFPILDIFVRKNIPCGHSVRQTVHKFVDNEKTIMREVYEVISSLHLNGARIDKSLGTLGGGNHFIEIDKDDNGRYWLVIHSGSRNFGLQIATAHQKIAKEHMKDIHGINYPYKGQEYLEGKNKDDYFSDMKIAQKYARLNRRIMAYELLSFFNIDILNTKSIKSVHNYIDLGEGIIRKGAISAKENEQVIIPLNMRDGVIIGKGKGNAHRNFSAPHGAGRKISRRKAKEELDFEEYKREMEGIWSSCIKLSTLDESPMAYKTPEHIVSTIEDAIEIESVMKPVYVFKSDEEIFHKRKQKSQ